MKDHTANIIFFINRSLDLLLKWIYDNTFLKKFSAMIL